MHIKSDKVGTFSESNYDVSDAQLCEEARCSKARVRRQLMNLVRSDSVANIQEARNDGTAVSVCAAAPDETQATLV